MAGFQSSNRHDLLKTPRPLGPGSERGWSCYRHEFLVRQVVLTTSLWLVSVAGFPCAGEMPTTNEADFPEVLWIDEEKAKAAFVSENKLNEMPLERFSNIGTLVRYLKIRRQPEIYGYMYPGGIIPECESLKVNRGPQGASSNQTGLESLVLATRGSFVGMVTKEVPGWDAWSNHTSLMAVMRIEEVIHTTTDAQPLQPDSHIAVLFSGGKITVHGTDICHKLDESFARPQVGSRFLVAGSSWEDDPNLFLDSFVLPIKGSEIQTQPYRELSTTASTESLWDLRDAARAESRNRPENKQ